MPEAQKKWCLQPKPSASWPYYLEQGRYQGLLALLLGTPHENRNKFPNFVNHRLGHYPDPPWALLKDGWASYPEVVKGEQFTSGKSKSVSRPFSNWKVTVRICSPPRLGCKLKARALQGRQRRLPVFQLLWFVIMILFL